MISGIGRNAGLVAEMFAGEAGFCGLKAEGVERLVAAGEGAEEAIEEVEADAKVAVETALLVERTMMDVAEAASAEKPGAHDGSASHPEVGQMHAVMKVSEHQDGPSDRSEETEGAIRKRNAQERHGKPERGEDDGRRDEPFEADVADRGAIAGGLAIWVGTQGGVGSVHLEMMNEVAAAEQREPLTMQQAMQPVAGELGDDAGSGDGEQHFDETCEQVRSAHFAPQQGRPEGAASPESGWQGWRELLPQLGLCDTGGDFGSERMRELADRSRVGIAPEFGAYGVLVLEDALAGGRLKPKMNFGGFASGTHADEHAFGAIAGAPLDDFAGELVDCGAGIGRFARNRKLLGHFGLQFGGDLRGHFFRVVRPGDVGASGKILHENAGLFLGARRPGEKSEYGNSQKYFFHKSSRCARN